MDLLYTGEFIKNGNGIECEVLDVSKLDFSNAPVGRKNKKALVIKAKCGEKIETINALGLVESVFTASAGDAIFCNSEKDRYVPRNSDGSAWKFDEITSYDYAKSKLLIECIKKPTCIKNVWGEKAHQFLFNGATLKQDGKTGKVTGIEKEAFDTTWQVLDKRKTL